MGFWEFMTVLVVFTSVFGYLRSLRVTSDRKLMGQLKKRLEKLEADVGGEGERGQDLGARVDALEEIVTARELALEQQIAALDKK